MRLGLIIYGNLDAISGGYLYDRKLVECLRAQGDTVEIISLPWRNYAWHLMDNLSPDTYRRLVNLDIEILLQDELNHPSLFWINQRLRQRKSYPIVSIVHHLRSREGHPAWQSHFYRRIERAYLASVNGFIYNSRATGQTVQALMPSERPFVVAYPGGEHLPAQIQEEAIVQRALQPGPLRLLFVGNLIPRKGVHTLLQALRSLSPQTWTLSVVGRLDVDRRYSRYLLHLARKWHLEARVRFTGALEQSRLIAEMEASHVMVLPSSYEGFGIACLEAMGFGLVPLVSAQGGAVELVTPGVEGYLIPPEDANALGAALLELQRDRRRLAEMGLAARRRYLAHPTWSHSAAQVRSFLQDLVHAS